MGLLDGAGDVSLYLLRRRIGIRDLDEDPGEFDIGELLQGQQSYRHQPDQRERYEDHHRRDGATQREFGVPHVPASWIVPMSRSAVLAQRLRSISE